MDPIQQPNPQVPQSGQSLNDLIYKTMPKAGAPVAFQPTPLAKETPVPAAPVPVAKPVMPEAPKPAAPFSTELKPVSAAMPNPTLLSDIPTKSGFKMTKSFMYASIVVGLLIVAVIVVLVLKSNGNNQEAVTPKNTQTETPKEVVSTQIPDAWRVKYFGAAVCVNADNCGDAADPDHDGLINLDEYTFQTDPNNPDSDIDGIADGDEVHLFALDPVNNNTSGDPKFLDAMEVKSHWNAKQKRAFNDLELTTISKNITTYGLHSPTIATVGQTVVDFYTNYAQTTGGSTSQNPSLKPGALDRDTQRSETIKQLSFALLKYKQANSKYPDTNVFDDMIKGIKPLLTGKALNTSDPTNVAPYVYAYQSVSKGVDFKLSYFSETQNQLITISQKEAQASYDTEMISLRDAQRKADLESIAQALELYANENTSPSTPDVHLFPSQTNWKKAISPDYISVIPIDPTTKKDYEYSISNDSTDFALQAVFENPPTGKTGYVCTASSCEYY